MTGHSAKQERLFLLDGTALAYRSYFAFVRNPLINSKGIHTSAVFGFTNTLMKILKEEKPEYIACAFDTSAPTFRHKRFPQYKATREKMPEELVAQLPLIRETVESFSIPIIEVEGYEADDVMGTLGLTAARERMKVYLVTGDKDFTQLVSPSLLMYSPGRSGEAEIIDENAVMEKWGVRPEQMTDLLGLTGDTSDNVPGIPGIGPKTALELLKQFGSLSGVIANAGRIERASVRQKVEAYADQALLSQELVTIDTRVNVGISLSGLKKKPVDRDRIIALFQELEFNRLLKDLTGLEGQSAESGPRHYEIVDSREGLAGLLKQLKKVPMFSVDLETTSLDPISAHVVGLSFSWERNQAVYIPVRIPEGAVVGDLFQTKEGAVDRVLDELKPVLEDPGIRKCGQNIKYDMLVLKRHGIALAGVDFDSMVAAYLINPSARQFGIDVLALEYLHIQKIPTRSLIGSGRNQISMADVPLGKISEYACEDADVAWRLREVLEPKLASGGMDALFREVEVPLLSVLMEMEDNGVALDTRLLSEMSGEMQGQLDRLQNDVFDLAGERFNINSTQQLGRILFEKLKVHEELGMRRPKRTKTGYATDVQVLESLSRHPLPKKLLEYRQLTKLKSTYVDALPKLVNPKTGRIHASFNQTATTTGRLSTSDPNLQNIPIRTDIGREIRRAFISGEKGWQILSADYSQIELKIMAHLSGDETLLDSFRKGEDVHLRTAVEIFGILPEKVTPEQRRQAKTINFGIMYGMGAYGLAQRLSISNEEAQGFITAYFARYPKVNAYITRTIAQAYETGFVTTLLNRRRFLPELKSNNRNIREFGERTAVNTPIQGTAADLIKVAMIRITDRLHRDEFRSKMILQIHDELVFESPDSEIDAMKAMVKHEMENAIELSVVPSVDIGVGRSWFEAH